MDPNNQSFPDFPTVDPPDFGGGGSQESTGQQTDTNGGSTAGSLASLGGGIGSLGGDGDSQKKRTLLIVVGGIIAVILSGLFVFLYFYFQDQGGSSDDFYTPPVQQPVQTTPSPIATDEADITGDDSAATESADTDDTAALDEDDQPTTASAETVFGSPTAFTESEFFTIDLPENWEVTKATQPAELYVEEYTASIKTEIGDEPVQVGLIRFQVSDKLLANQIDPDLYEIIEENEVLVGGTSATQIEYQEKDAEDPLPILNILTNDAGYSYRVSFTVNPKYDNATAVRNAFIESLLTISFSGSGSGTDPDEPSDATGPDAAEQQSVPDDGEEAEQDIVSPDQSSPPPGSEPPDIPIDDTIAPQ